jgi:lipoprotein signal peptidase
MNSQPRRTFLWLFWLLAATGLLMDQTSKYGIFAALYNDANGGALPLIPGAFNLTADYPKLPVPVPDDWLRPLRTVSGDHMPRVNHGALFGFLGRDEHGNDGNLLFTVVSLAAALAIVLWITCTAASCDRLLCVSLGLILAGTLGNLYDRLVFDGVRDFLHWNYLIDWPVFNLADCCLVCGASLLLFQALFLQPHAAAPEPAPTATQDVPIPETVNAE